MARMRVKKLTHSISFFHPGQGLPNAILETDRGFVVEIATARGKARYDKRQAIAKRDALRETQRALKGDRE